MPKSDLIAIKRYGEIEIHFVHPTGNYASLCGMDGNDDSPSVDQVTVDLPSNAKVNCSECIRTFYFVKELSPYLIAAEHRLHQTAGGRGPKKYNLVVPAAGKA